MYLVYNGWIFIILDYDIINFVLLVLVSFYVCTNTPSMETIWVLLGLACFFDLNKVHLPTYLPTYLPLFFRTEQRHHWNHASFCGRSLPEMRPKNLSLLSVRYLLSKTKVLRYQQLLYFPGASQFWRTLNFTSNLGYAWGNQICRFFRKNRSNSKNKPQNLLNVTKVLL